MNQTVAKVGFGVVIREDDWRLLTAVIAAAEKKYGECSWLGVGKMDGQAMLVSSIIYPEQKNSRGETDMPQGALAVTLAEACRDGMRILWWGHSHGSMSTFYSGTDEATWKEWTSGNPEIFLGTCHNIKGETYVRLRLGGINLELDRFPIFITRPAVPDEAVAAAMEKMSSQTYTRVVCGGGDDYDRPYYGMGRTSTPDSGAQRSADNWRSKPPTTSREGAGACRIMDAVAQGAGIRLVNSDGARDPQNEGCPAWKTIFGRQPTLILTFDDASSLRMYQGVAKDHPYTVYPSLGSSALLAAAYIGSYREMANGQIASGGREMVHSKAPTTGWYTAMHAIVAHFLAKWSRMDTAARMEMLGIVADDGNTTREDMENLEYYCCGDDVLLWMMLEALEDDLGGAITAPPFLDLANVRKLGETSGVDPDGTILVPQGELKK